MATGLLIAGAIAAFALLKKHKGVSGIGDTGFITARVLDVQYDHTTTLGHSVYSVILQNEDGSILRATTAGNSNLGYFIKNMVGEEHVFDLTYNKKGKIVLHRALDYRIKY